MKINGKVPACEGVNPFLGVKNTYICARKGWLRGLSPKARELFFTTRQLFFSTRRMVKNSPGVVHIPKYLWYLNGSIFRNIRIESIVNNSTLTHFSIQFSIGNRSIMKMMK